jgi:pimeloyl-ACP methyl ester carboxylesterase
MPHAQVNNTGLYHEIRGSGPPLLLIGGLGCDHRAWALQVGPLSRHFTVITYDQRGLGLSSPAPADFTFGVLASDAVELLGALGHEKASIVGMSMGGAVAQRIALDFPGAVERLVLAATSAHTSDEESATLEELCGILGTEGYRGFAEKLAEWTFTEEFRERHAKQVEMTISVLAENAQRGDVILRQMELLAAYDFRRELPAVRKPTMAICGRRDMLAPPHRTMEFTSLLPGCNTCQIDETGHGMAIERAGEFNSILLRFLGAAGMPERK